MGRVTQPPDTAAAPSPSPQHLTHFTHPHPLFPLSLSSPHTLICSGCKLHAAGTMYGCEPCNFILHHSCATLPPRITHPSHDGCKLSLLTVAPYHGGEFSCDACGRRSNSWSYHCARCEYDLHVTCAAKPLKIRHQFHVSCELDLMFKNPYVNSAGFSCDICGKIGSKQWLYRCNSCEFDVHLDCTAVAKPQPAILQHHNSWPATASGVHQHGQMLHSASSGGMNFPAAAGQVSGGFVGPHQPHLMHSMSAPNYNQVSQGLLMMSNQQPGMMMNNQQPAKMLNNQQPARAGLGSSLMGAAMQGLVEGAFQGIGQAVVQEVIGGGDGGGFCGGDGGGDGGGEM